MKSHFLTFGMLPFLLFSCKKAEKTPQLPTKIYDSTSVTKIAKPDPAVSSEVTSPGKSKIIQKVILIRKTDEIPGKIDKHNINNLSEPLKAIAALYSGLGGSNCNGENCELTTALGLGKQGSQAQKDLVKKWFPNDKIAEQLIKQDFYKSPNTSSNFSDFKFLIFEQNGNTVTVNYDLFIYNHGEESSIEGPDQYLIKENSIETLNRNIWKDVK